MIELNAKADLMITRKDKRCYIATAVYGAEAWQTQALRDFRDTSLMSSMVGKAWSAFTTAYHRRWLGRPQIGPACKAGRLILDPIVKSLRC